LRVALVTGAGRGIGAAVAERLSRSALVVVADRNGEAAERVASGVGGEAVAVDVSDPEAVDALVAGIVERHGRLDWACNNAGVTGIEASFDEYPRRVFERVLAINAGGVFACMQAELRQMAAQSEGAIVNVVSGSASLGVPGHAAYVASKHAAAGLTRTAAIEYAPRGVRVNAVAPGLVLTPAMESVDLAEFAAAHPIGRAVEAAEIAEVVAWLLESAPAALTGALIPVDGGLMAQVPGH
jgi:NAD(P)-dependent dehydrogenase (short-subunit alcohol dehydrogenase family)